ncbi:MAG: GNAT family N-acetyltransferase [Dehalococcoidia bacterium]|nr:GNAT family N-acetyltransferase [Dehalococcoidia bacterium]
MNIKITNLTEDNLKDAPEWDSHPFSCKYCIYWEYPEECTNPATEQKEEMFAKKLGWLQRVTKEFGNCGKLAYVDRESVSYAQYAPHHYLPGSAGYAAGPPSDDAVLISCLFIPQAKFRRLGIGGRLLRSISDELKQRKKTKAIETFARRGSSDNPSGPVQFYLRNGFRIHGGDKEFPLMRLDL